jgi:hypothetical protein
MWMTDEQYFVATIKVDITAPSLLDAADEAESLASLASPRAEVVGVEHRD